jgi:hypothetical protein
MTISNDLFLSILSLDSYNHGYGAGIEGLGGEHTQIGTATIKKSSSQLLDAGADVAAGFYAISYTWNGTTVISYRGTDNPAPEYFGTDLPIHSGDYDEAELALAAQFRNAVGASLAPDATVILTGHSLGGALARH